MGIWYASYSYPNSEIPLIFIAKAKNLITGEDAHCFCNRWYDNSTSYYVYFRDKSKLYTNYYNAVNTGNYINTYYPYACNNTAAKFVCEPITGYSGTYYVYSLIKACDDFHVRGNYYKLGEDIYFCYGYKESTSTTCSGSYLLMKVS